MATESIRIGYRPLRVGFCVEEGKIEQVIKAVNLNTILWGGIYNPIIPVGKDPNFANVLVKLFHPDLLYNVAGSNEISNYIDGYDYLEWPWIARNDIFKPEGKGKIFPNFFDVSNIIEYYWDTQFKSIKKSNCIVPSWSARDSLAHVFALEFGQYPNNSQIAYQYIDAFKSGMRAKPLSIVSSKNVPKDLIRKATPLKLTKDRLTLISHSGWGWNDPGFYVGYSDNFDDLVNFWNLRASGITIKFLAISEFKRQLAYSLEWASEVKKNLKLSTGSPDLTFWYRSEVDEKTISKITKSIVKKGETQSRARVDRIGVWNGLNVKTSEPNFDTKSILANVDWSYEEPSITFQLPEKPVKIDRINDSQLLVLTIKPISEFTYEGYTIDLPFLPSCNQWYGREITLELESFRIGRDSLGIIIPLRKETERLKPIRKSELIKKIFDTRNIKAIDSQAGLLTQQVIEQFGGKIDDCRVLKITGVRNLIRSLNPNECISFSAAKEAIKDAKKSNGKASFNNFTELYIQRRETPKLTIDEVFKLLVEKNVFRIGLNPKCPNCKLKFWISLNEAKENINCEYCGREFKLATQLSSRGDFCYRRSGLFGKNNNQEGSLPVILTLMQLIRRQGFPTFSYSTALKLTSKRPSIDCESDLVCITKDFNNNLSVLIGECKTGQDISQVDIDNLVKVKNTLDYEYIKTYILFAKISSFSNQEIKRFKKLTKLGIFPILFSQRDLEPYEPDEYYRKKKIKLPREFAVNFDDMAINSQFIYLK